MPHQNDTKLLAQANIETAHAEATAIYSSHGYSCTTYFLKLKIRLL